MPKVLFIRAVDATSEVESRYPGLGLAYLVSSLRSHFGDNYFEFKIIERGNESEVEKQIEIKSRLGINPGKKIITFSGRLVPLKRVDVLLKAVRGVLESQKDIQVFILGQGELQESLQKMASDFGIASHVFFKNLVPNILDYLQISDIFVFPSEKEGMPNSLLEAMACRLPVIATRIGGVVDIIKDGENGIIVTPGNDEELKEAILMLIENIHLAEAIAENAYNYIKESYYIDKVADKYIQLYRGYRMKSDYLNRDF